MTLQALEISDLLDLVQLCLQIILLWLPGLVLFARTSPSPKFTLTVGLMVLVVFPAGPVSCFVMPLFNGRYALWVGLGSTISTLEISAAMAFVTMMCHTQVFKPENLTGYVKHPYRLVCLSISGFVALILAVAVAARERQEVGVVLAGLGLSCIQFACLLWADGRTADRREAKVLLVSISAILVAEVLSLSVCFLVALFRNNVIVGFDVTSKCVRGLSLLSLWGQALVNYSKTLLNLFSRAKSIIDRLDSDKTLLPISSDDPSQRRPPSVINLNSVGSAAGEAHRVSGEHLVQADVHSSTPATPFSQPAGVHAVGHPNNLLPDPLQPLRPHQFSSTPSARLVHNSSHRAFTHGHGAQKAPPTRTHRRQRFSPEGL